MYNYSILLYIFSIILFIISMVEGVRTEKEYNKTKTAIGTIIDINLFGCEPLYFSKWATISYYVNDKFYTSENRILVSRVSQVGDTMEIRYFPEQPEVLYNKKIKIYYIILTLSFICALTGFLYN